MIKEAFAQKLINHEDIWLLMLKDRNMTSHVYKEEMGNEIVERIVTLYTQEMEELLVKIKADHI